MKQVLIILLLLIQGLAANAQNKIGAIGQWRGHFDNHNVISVTKGDYIYSASPYQIIKLDDNGVINWIDKTTGLHDINITNLGWDPIQEQLIITYKNSNIDILKGDQVFNINSIQLTNLYNDKKINSIYVLPDMALLATNFGIVSIDLKKHEIKNTWIPNPKQEPTITYGVAIIRDSIFAATENGIWTCPFNNNTVIPSQWSILNQYANLSIKHLVSKNSAIFASSANAIYKLPNTHPIVQFNYGIVQKVENNENNLNICIQYPSEKGALLQLNENLSLNTIIDSTQLKAPIQSIYNNNKYWVADSSQGLLYKSNSAQWVELGGTGASIHGNISTIENNLLAPYANSSGYTYFNSLKWNRYTKLNDLNLPKLFGSTISKLDGSFWFSAGNNLVHTTNNNTQVSLLKPNISIGSFKEIHADQNNFIWVIQDQQGLVRQTTSGWNTISLPNELYNVGLEKFIINNQQQAWIIAPNNQGIYLYQSKDIYGAEVWKQLSTSASNGNLPSMNVTSIASDKVGSIWVGTNNGIAIFNCGDIATAPCNAYLPIVNNNGFNGYLFQKEIVNCIAVDGANRKWIGTNNGAWLLSEDGLKIIEHFTKSNSPLPTDTIAQIVIEPTQGEVFFNTSNQMVSFRGTATEGIKTQEAIQIFPNPIPPNFNGVVAFKGLVENAVVKITDLTGKLLYQTNALGGQAIWNARTYEGKKVATGIYLVFVRDLSGNEKNVGKIVIADGY